MYMYACTYTMYVLQNNVHVPRPSSVCMQTTFEQMPSTMEPRYT